jgi:cytochrome c oxidase assembly factor CtaG
MNRPYEWHFHLTTWVTLMIAVALVVLGHRHRLRTSDHPIRWTRHDIWVFAGASGASLVALTWPVADLAAHWSLTALVIQRLILILAVAPLLLLGLPYDVLERITRPAWVDAALSRCRRPAVAIGFVTILTVGSMIPPMVQAQASIAALRGVLAVTMVIAGLVLWIPVLGRVPGIPRLRPIVRFGYLAAQGVVPAFLSFALILAPHPLYPVFAESKAAIDLRPLNDQQIAGFVSKLTMLIVLLSVGGIGLARASSSDEEIRLDERLVWADVKRQFERADRKTSLRHGHLAVVPPQNPSISGGSAPPDVHPSPGEFFEHDGPDP